MVFTKAIPVAASTVPSACRAMRRTHPDQGFTLVELMLVALLSCLLCGVAFQLLFAETRQGGSLAETLQLKQWHRRTPELVQGDLEHASGWRIDPDASVS